MYVRLIIEKRPTESRWKLMRMETAAVSYHTLVNILKLKAVPQKTFPTSIRYGGRVINLRRQMHPDEVIT